MPDAGPVDEVFIPGGTPTPTPLPAVPVVAAPDQDSERMVIRVQWRDIAGNWSEPVKLPVQHQPDTQVPPETAS